MIFLIPLLALFLVLFGIDYVYFKDEDNKIEHKIKETKNNDKEIKNYIQKILNDKKDIN